MFQRNGALFAVRFDPERVAVTGDAVPVIDGVSCAVRLAEALVGLNPAVPQAGSFARPPAKPARGLGPALQARISRDPG